MYAIDRAISVGHALFPVRTLSRGLRDDDHLFTKCGVIKVGKQINIPRALLVNLPPDLRTPCVVPLRHTIMTYSYTLLLIVVSGFSVGRIGMICDATSFALF